MTKTKRSLLLSAISLLLCFSMLIGSTFAWFTDSVTSFGNKIQSGTLKVDLELLDKKTGEWNSIKEENTPIFNYLNWEPGFTDVKILKIENEGSLALKWVAQFVSQNALSTLADVIDVYVDTTAQSYPTDREAVATWTYAGTVAEFVNTISQTTKGTLTAQGTAGDTAYLGIALKMREEADNDYQGLDLGGAFDIKIYATQLTSEKDSFDENYDDNAEYFNPWNGEAGEVPEAVDNVITINTAEEFAAFANSVNSGTNYSGKTVKLAKSINLANKAWTPIGATNSPAYFQGTFDGQGNTIYGLNVDNSSDTYMYSTAGLFGWIDAAKATIKNVNISGATVKGSHWVGALVGYMTGDVINCSVDASTVTGYNVNDDANGDKIGGLIGYMNSGSGTIEGNVVSNTTVSGYRDVAGLAGAVATTNTVKNNTVENVTVGYESDYAAEIVSPKTAVVVDETNKAVNVTLVKGKIVAKGVVQVAERSYEVTGKEGLLNINNIIANSSTGEGVGIKVKLMSDVDLSGVNWKPIDKMWIDFDGNGKTISNLTANAWQAGFFGYLGGGSIKNLTLENVNVTGAQAAAFAGSVEGTIEGCVLKGINTITYAEKHQYDDPNANIESWGGIGAITGILQPNTINATIDEDAIVTLNYGSIETEASYVDTLTGYIGTNSGTVVNNGTVKIKKDVYDNEIMGGLYEYLPTLEAGDVLILPEKTYETSGTFTIPHGVTIKGAEGANVVIHQISDQQDDIFNCEGDVTIENISFESNRKGYAITDNTKNHATNGNITVINCKFKGIAEEKNYGIYKNLNGNLTVKNCSFDNYNNAICGVNNGSNSTTVIEGCTFTNINGEAIGYETDTLPTNFEETVISNNTGLTTENVIEY